MARSHVRHLTERHRSHRTPWLRAAVLGANDGIVSVAALLLGVASASNDANIVVTGVAGLVAGALSMAVGEYVSVASQRDLERAEFDLETEELRDAPEAELRELRDIYIGRGLTPDLAQQVADQMTAHDALEAHLRDELGLAVGDEAEPAAAAASSAVAFAAGGLLPVVAATLVSGTARLWAIGFSTLLAMAMLGLFGARASGASPIVSTRRVLLGGIAAMALSVGVGSLIGGVV